MHISNDKKLTENDLSGTLNFESFTNICSKLT